MMSVAGLESSMTVEEVLTRWPQTAPVFNHYKSACVGCALSPFCTLEDVAGTYHLDLAGLLADLSDAVRSSEPEA
jgi:hybrid cluster-associated redox disulfide protein